VFLGIHNKTLFKTTNGTNFHTITALPQYKKKDWTYTDMGKLVRRSLIKQANPFEL